MRTKAGGFNHGDKGVGVRARVHLTRDRAGPVNGPPSVELGSIKICGCIVLFWALVCERARLADLEDIAAAVRTKIGLKEERPRTRVPHNHELLLVASHVQLAKIIQIAVVGQRGLIIGLERLEHLEEEFKVAKDCRLIVSTLAERSIRLILFLVRVARVTWLPM